VPAAFCGVYGIRPTHGRIDMTGAMAMAPSFDVPGWFASGPGVFRRVGEVLLEGAGVHAKPRQLIILDDAFAEADAEVASLLRAAIDTMASDLPKPIHEAVAPGGFDTWRESFRVIQAREIWSIYGPFVERHQPKLGPGIRERMAFAATVSERDADMARQEQKRARERICALVEPGTVLALPTAPCIAPRIDTGAEALESVRVRVMRLTCVAGLSGLPQVTLPVGSISGCPIGLSFIAWHGGDEALLDLAVQLARHVGAVSDPRPK
jgi:amidase